MDIQVKQMPAYDVIVVGGGIAGIAAAVAAATSSKRSAVGRGGRNGSCAMRKTRLR